jgi:HlyD family secretion protein
MKRRLAILVILAAAAAAALVYHLFNPRQFQELTGIVTTDTVRVGAELQGRLAELKVEEGEPVKKGQLLAVIRPEELQADLDYSRSSEKEAAAQLDQAKADLSLLEAQVREQVRQARANLARNEALVRQAEADLAYAKQNFDRIGALQATHSTSKQDYDQARTTYMSARAKASSLEKEVEAARAALSLAQASDEQIVARRAAVAAGRDRLAAAGTRIARAEELLSRTRIVSPIDGVVDVRVALQGEVVKSGETVLTLIDPDNLWIRADVEETSIDRIHLGDTMQVRLPSGAVRPGTVFFRGVDADYATQRDVSRSKRDIRTFQIRLRCDNADRSLAPGMTAYVLLPEGRRP